VPVVVRLDHELVEGEVGPLVEDLAREPGPVGEVEAGQLPARRHVAHALVDVVDALAHLLEAGRLHAVFLERAADDGVQAHRRPLLALVFPVVGAGRGLLQLGRGGQRIARQVLVEHVGGFADVVIDADDDQVVHLHGVSS